jgi:ABC-type multidrug transport system fused ATPase/permease subunit
MPHLVGKLYNSIKDDKKAMTPILIGIAVVILAIQGIHIIDDFINIKLHPVVYKFIREKMMKHIFKMSETNYNDIEIGEIISKVVKLPSVIHNHIDLLRGEIIPDFFTIIASVIYVTYVDWKLGLPLIGVISIFITTLIYSSDVCSASAFKRDEKFSLIMSNVNDVMRNMITIMSFDKTDAELERIDDIHKDYIGHTEDTLHCSLISKYITIPCMMLYVLYSCYYCYGRVNSGKMTTGTFISVLIILFVVMNMIFNILGSWKDILLRSGIIQHSLDTFEECKIVRASYDKPAGDPTGIVFQDVDFAYVSKDMQRPVFKDFQLKIRMKETTLIVGEIGSGKSTIISMLMKYQTPQAGEIFIQGTPYSTIDVKELRRRISYIPQTPMLLNRTVYDNIVYGLTAEKTRADVEELIRSLSLSKFLDNLPKGLDTPVGIHGSKLSGGQRQIVWILKSILMNPEIIIMDEPTSAIDDATKSIVHHLLKKVMVGKTVIMITHDPYLLKFANRILTLKEGRIINDARV